MKKCYVCGSDVKKLINMGKHKVCSVCVSNGDDTWESVDLDLSENVLAGLAKIALEENLTINMVIVKALSDFIEINKSKSPEEIREIFKTQGVKIDFKNDNDKT